MKSLVTRFLKDQSGATAIEYALIGSLIALAIIVAVRSVGTNASAKFSAIAGNLT